MAEKELTPEEIALQESEAALAAEEKARAEKSQPKDLAEEYAAEQAAKAAEKPEEKPEEKAEAKPEGEVEKKPEPEKQVRSKEVDAIVALRKHAQMLAERNFMLEGQVEALSKVAMAKPAQDQQQPAKKDRLDEIKESKLEMAKKVDAGEMTIEEYELQRTALEDEAFDLRLAKKQPKQQVVQQPQEDLYLAEQTAQLAAKYPFLEELSEEDLAPFAQLAKRQAALDGVQLIGSAGTLELRRRMVELAAKVYQPVVKRSEEKTVEAATDDKSKALEQKLKLQNKMPPDVSNIGSGGNSAGISEAEVARRLFDPNTTTEQAEALIASLPPTLRDKLMVR